MRGGKFKQYELVDASSWGGASSKSFPTKKNAEGETENNKNARVLGERSPFRKFATGFLSNIPSLFLHTFDRTEKVSFG